jgi:hypothetical protein
MDLCPCVALLHQSPCCFHCGSIIGDSEFHAMPCCCCCCRPCSCSDHARHDSNSMHTLMPRCRFSSLLSFHACTSCRENFPRVFSSSLLHQPNLLTSAAVSSQGYGHRQWHMLRMMMITYLKLTNNDPLNHISDDELPLWCSC